MRVNDRLVWVDCEMTGLDIERDALVEIACLVTDADLTLLDEGVDVIIRPPAEALAEMPSGPRDAHQLRPARRLPTGSPSPRRRTRARLHRGHVPEPRRRLAAIHRHRPLFIARDMPDLDAYLHYRMVDVSTIKEPARRWYPRAYFASPNKHGGHGHWPTSGDRPGTAVLPGDGVRPAARTGFDDRARDRGPVHRARCGG